MQQATNEITTRPHSHVVTDALVQVTGNEASRQASAEVWLDTAYGLVLGLAETSSGKKPTVGRKHLNAQLWAAVTHLELAMQAMPPGRD